MQAGRLVFVSHISEDRAVAEWLKESLNRDFIETFEVFVSSDTKSITVGEPWLESVQEALTRARLLITLCSPASIHRPWINFEVGAAWVMDKQIIPVCHSGLTPEELPMPLSLRQGLQVNEAAGLARLYDALAGAFGSGIPAQDFEALAQQAPSGRTGEPEGDPNVVRRLREGLASSRYEWRSLEWVAAEAGVSEAEAADVLRADDQVRFSKGKSERTIVGLKSRVGTG